MSATTERLVPPVSAVITPAQRLERRIAAWVVVGPLVGTAVALALAGVAGVSALDLGLCFGLYVLTMFGITGGFHRHFTHRGFKAVPWLRVALGGLGSMAAQGPLLYWAAAHRRHHRFADREGDPHSPGEGFWHAHVGWMLRPVSDDWIKLVPDLLKDDLAFGLHRHYFRWVALGLVWPAVVGGLMTMSLAGAFTAFLWGGLVRMCLVHHATWLVNSWCHSWGSRPNATADTSTNSWWCAVLTLGEGWHNNHHDQPAAANHGRAWWQVDATAIVLRAAARLGLVSEVLWAD